ncbi:MAG TPA: hypothetical protein VGO76_09915 [Luteibacter sp.]|jgi:hypothetical protein|nr:hypothetical protein [Luteibacter sp.]
MHLELPQGALESTKDFARHFVMIVISILTALGLEAWIEHTHHRHAAETASVGIEAEVRLNLEDIRKVRGHDTERMKALEKLRDSLVQDIRDNAAQSTIDQHVHAATPDGLYLDWRWPTLRHTAWDVAVANQAAGWIDSDRLAHYSSVYTFQQKSDTVMAEDLPTVLNGPRMGDAMTDLQTGSVPPRELLHVVAQMAALMNEAVHNLDSLEKKIVTELPAAAS